MKMSTMWLVNRDVPRKFRLARGGERGEGVQISGHCIFSINHFYNSGIAGCTRASILSHQ